MKIILNYLKPNFILTSFYGGVLAPEILASLTDTGENVQKWTRVFSTRRRVILVARTRRKKREENGVSTFERFRLWTSFESSPVSVNVLIGHRNHPLVRKIV